MCRYIAICKESWFIDLINLKLDMDKLWNDKLKTIPATWNKLKSEVNGCNFDKLKRVPVDLKNLVIF